MRIARQRQNCLDRNVHGGHVERLEHDLRHVLQVGLEVQRSCREQDVMFLGRNPELVYVVPDFLHVGAKLSRQRRDIESTGFSGKVPRDPSWAIHGRRRGLDSDALASAAINVIQLSLHAVNVLLQAELHILRLGGVDPQQFSNLGSEGGVLTDSKLQAPAILFVEHAVVIIRLGNFCKHFQVLLHEVHLDHAQNLVLLQSFPRDAQSKILCIHDAFDKIQSLLSELIAINHDDE